MHRAISSLAGRFYSSRIFVVVSLLLALGLVAKDGLLGVFDARTPRPTILKIRNETASFASSSGGSNNDPDPALQFPKVNFSGAIARRFEEWSHDFPCYPPNPEDHLLDRMWQDKSNATQGLLYEKPHKCASTTVAGVNMRIARNVAKRSQLGMDLCDMRWSHGQQWKGQRYAQRNRTRSFLWSIIREPTPRYVSWYFFQSISLKGQRYSDQSFQSFLRKQKPHFYLQFLSTRPLPPIPSETRLVQELNFVLTEYDFIGIVERLHESLVVLMMLLKLPMADLLYYSSKLQNGYFTAAPGTRCILIQGSHVSEGMKDFFASDEWQAQIRSDAMLYEAVNRSLDLTIDKLGRDNVQREYQRFQNAQNLVNERCQGKVVLPCNKEGSLSLAAEKTGCLFGDVGCGMECLDAVSTELGLWT